jgi:hypothetical protein
MSTCYRIGIKIIIVCTRMLPEKRQPTRFPPYFGNVGLLTPYSGYLRVQPYLAFYIFVRTSLTCLII